MEQYIPLIFTASKYMLIPLSLLILLRCIRSMLSSGYESETWATVRYLREAVDVTHWENLIGRARSADIRIDRESVERTHAVLTRRDDGRWMLFDVFARGGVAVDGRPVGSEGAELSEGSVARIGDVNLRLQDLGAEKGGALEAKRSSVGKRITPALTLAELTVFELLLLLQHLITSPGKRPVQVALGFAVLILLEWFCYYAMRLIGRSGFEVETIAFYLTALGVSVTASSAPQDMFKQSLLILAAFVLFVLLGLWLRDLRRSEALRPFAAVLALGLLALNIFTSTLATSCEELTHWKRL